MVDPEFDRVIPPGKEGRVHAKILTERLSGKVSKTILVKTDDPGNREFRLRLEANVVPLLRFAPSEGAFFGEVRYGQGAVQELTIEGEEGRPLEITDVKTSHDFIGASLGKNRTTGGYALKVTVGKEAPIGVTKNGTITFKTNYKERPEVMVPVSMIIKGPIEYQESVLFRISKDDTAELTKTLTFTSTDGKAFEVTKAETNKPERVSAALKTIEKGHKYEVTLKYVGDMDDPTFLGRLEVTTTHPLQPDIKVTLIGRAWPLRRQITVPGDVGGK